MEQISQHKLPPEFQLTKIMEMEIGNYFFYGNVVIVEAKEGIMLSYKKDLSVILLIQNITEGKPWVYISNRVNSYSIQPLDYKYLNKVPSLKALGVVNFSEVGYLNSELEAKFCKKPFQMFYNLNEAVIWGKTYL
ncbi:hypothetical protein [Aequorivita lipolytica]|uniref:STAS/SEC14 domain-containing protein n=1 Tax=Aequorivita lipolytica TaxID=153267 RepID=A0A5C6YQB7_9FLAO|nr:hypothetical protein [Aequorivita lipolytica]TXD69659.1 hypothetical protein ESV24_07445 [Aequorivita lipolytica]SRX51152.1 hypothetical protein AEQU2_01632 [Aequorivita lipolytica]